MDKSEVVIMNIEEVFPLKVDKYAVSVTLPLHKDRGSDRWRKVNMSVEFNRVIDFDNDKQELQILIEGILTKSVAKNSVDWSSRVWKIKNGKKICNCQYNVNLK